MPEQSLGEYFSDINLLAAMQFMPGERPYVDKPSTAPEPKELLLYLGCNVLRTAHLARTAIDVLRAMGFDFNAAGGPAHCCGIIHFQAGDAAGARAVSSNSMRNFAQYGAKQVLMWCPSCNEHYDDVVTQEQDVAFPYEHITAFLARHLDRVRFTKRVERRVAVHHHTGFAQADLDRENIRRILEAIPGLEIVDVANPILGRHCIPRWINRIGRAQWQAHIARDFDAAAAAGVSAVVTPYHSCQRELCQAEATYPFELLNYISLLGVAMGIEYPDSYKRWKIAADPETTLEEVQPYLQANGIDPARARGVLQRSFAPACATDPRSPS